MQTFKGRPVTIEPSHSRHGSIRVACGERIVVRVPRGMPAERVMRELEKFWPRVERRLAKIPPGLVVTPCCFESGEQLTHLGRRLTLSIENISIPVVDGDLLRLPIEHPRRHLIDWLRMRTYDEARQSASAFAQRLGVSFERLEVRHYRSRLGCCLKRRDLRFHWGITLLPRDMFETVVAHEVVHLKHPHHQKFFWDELSGLIPEAREQHKILRLIGSQLRF